MDQNCIIRPETPADHRKVEHLVREAFWNVYRPGCNEHYILHCLRTDPNCVPELDLVLEREGEIIGQIFYMRAVIEADDGRQVPVMTFGPLSIAPPYQHMGYGKILLDHSLEKAAALGAPALCIEGNLAFYGKSGFVPADRVDIWCHGCPRGTQNPHFLFRALQPGFVGSVTGIYHTPQGYFVEEEAAEQYDATFPPKQKLKLPGQLV